MINRDVKKKQTNNIFASGMPRTTWSEIQDEYGIKSIYHIPLVKWIKKEPASNQNEVRGPDLETMKKRKRI